MPPTQLPAYEQVKAFVKAQINCGAWRPGDAVPSEAALQQQFGVSRMTVNRAVKELAVEGLVTRVQGSGTVVAQLHRISNTLALRDIHEEVLERGHAHTARVVLLESLRANAAMARTLQLRTGAKVFHSVLVHCEDGVPIQFEDRHVNPAAAPHYLSADFQSTTPTRYLLEHAPLTEASYSIEASLPSLHEAKCLAVKRSEPCLVMTRRTVSGVHVASLARLVYPGVRYSFNGKFQL
ncbi:histidine utilization repressor [Rhodoferax ferrireducens]|uniref:histidine utilization repressor n=1 Tax=Rhodoferax ferrireducens TaxID=192843 RepID=UPI000E0CEB06|nr:histidine utilization repressor [Rhodoferax ferrireducens]